MSRPSAAREEIHNRDRLICLTGAELARHSRDIRRAMKLETVESRAEVRRVARRLEGASRVLQWIGRGELDAPRPKRIDLVRIVRDIVRKSRPVLRRRGCRVHIDASPAKAIGHWDSHHLASIVGELLSNAVRHGAGHPVTIGIRGTDDEQVVLTVEDEGTGALPKRPFRRFVRGRRAEGEGMGVGLWLTATLATANGGDLLFDRHDGGGTRAIVRLRRVGSASRSG